MLSAIIQTVYNYPKLWLALVHHLHVQSGPFVQRRNSCNIFAFSLDMDRTVSRRSEPSSRTILTVEQTDPWKIVLNQDMVSRHRGANQSRRWEL